MALQFLKPSESEACQYLLTGYEDGTLVLWDAADRSQPRAMQKLHGEPIMALATHNQGSTTIDELFSKCTEGCSALLLVAPVLNLLIKRMPCWPRICICRNSCDSFTRHFPVCLMGSFCRCHHWISRGFALQAEGRPCNLRNQPGQENQAKGQRSL